MTSKTEIWKSLPGVPGVEVSTFGRVQTLDRTVSCGNGTRLAKGHVLKQSNSTNGYLQVHIPIDEKWATKSVHRLVAQTFLSNPDNLPQVNHKDCNRKNNNVENLEFCTASYNSKYREKYGSSQRQPVFAVSLATLEVSRFHSQNEASQAIGVNVGNIYNVIKGKYKQTGGYWFKEDDGNGIEIDKDKLKSIVDSMRFTGGVFAVNLNTLEVSHFESQSEASRVLGVQQSSITAVIKGRFKQTGGFWFVNADENADDAINRKIHEIKKIYN